MTISAHDMARELRRLLPDAGTLKLHKLLYYCQGWHLAWTGVPLFSEEIEAWANGPVVADLWHDEKRQRALPRRAELDSRAVQIMHFVVARYGRLNGQELRQLTHGEAPWLEVSERESETNWFDQRISRDSLRAFFGNTDGMAEEREQLAALRAGPAIYTFGPLEISPGRRAAIERAKASGSPG